MRPSLPASHDAWAAKGRGCSKACRQADLDLPGIELVEQLQEDEGIEDDLQQGPIVSAGS